MRIIFNKEQEDVLETLKNLKSMFLNSTTEDSSEMLIDYMVSQIEHVAVVIGGAEGLERLKEED